MWKSVCKTHCGVQCDGECDWTEDLDENDDTYLVRVNNSKKTSSGLFCCSVTAGATNQAVSSCVEITSWNKLTNATEPLPDPSDQTPLIIGLPVGIFLVAVFICTVCAVIVILRKRNQQPGRIPGT